MIGIKKRCPKLRKEYTGRLFCGSTGICHKQVCYSDIYETVIHHEGHIFKVYDYD